MSMSKPTLILKCIGLVTENHLPFSILATDNFKSIVNPYFDAIAAKDGEKKLRMNSQNVKEIVKAAAEKVRERIRLNVKNQLVSIKVDGATRQDRSIFGISCQYRKNGQIKLHTLGMITLKGPHSSTGLNLSGTYFDHPF
jgi:hypothetical protein